MAVQSLTRAAPGALAVASMLTLAACGGGGGDSPASSGAPSAAVAAVTTKNVNQVGAASYRFASDIFDATYAAADQLKSDPASQPTSGLDLAGVALDGVRRMFGASGTRIAGKSVPVRKAVLASAEPCDSGQVLFSVNDANNNQDIDVGETASVVFQNCVIGGVRFTGSFNMFVNAKSSTATVDSADVTFGFVDFASMDPVVGAMASASGDLRLSATITYATAQSATPASIRAAFSGGKLVSTALGDARTLSNYSGDLVLLPASNGYSFRVAGTASGASLPGPMTFATPVAVQGIYGAAVTAGTFVATSQDGSGVRMTVTAPTGVTIGLDANGDGVSESSTLLTWAQFEAL